MVRTSWVYNVKKEDLITYAQEFGLEADGTVEELRKTITTFVSEAGTIYEERLLELEAKHQRTPSPAREECVPESKTTAIPLKAPPANHLTVSGHGDTDPRHSEGKPATLPSIFVPTRTHSPTRQTSITRSQSPAPPPQRKSTPAATEMTKSETESDPKKGYASIMDQIRKWSVRFDGNKCPLAFMDRVEELADVYDIKLDWLPRTMPELLKDRALTWFRTNNRHWKTWPPFKDDFLQFFLPPRYFEHLKDTIRERHQQSKETFKDYVIAMLDLMRPTAYSEEKMLDRIYRNSRHEFQLHIKHREFDSLNELIVLAGDYEEVMRQISSSDAPKQPRLFNERNRQLTSDDSAGRKGTFNPHTVCRRCGQEGHFAAGCRNQQKLFCWDCGKAGTRTIECCRKGTGNDRGAHELRGSADPQYPVSRRQ